MGVQDWGLDAHVPFLHPREIDAPVWVACVGKLIVDSATSSKPPNRTPYRKFRVKCFLTPNPFITARRQAKFKGSTRATRGWPWGFEFVKVKVAILMFKNLFQVRTHNKNTENTFIAIEFLNCFKAISWGKWFRDLIIFKTGNAPIRWIYFIYLQIFIYFTNLFASFSHY